MPDHKRDIAEDAPLSSRVSPIFAADARGGHHNEDEDTRHHWRKYKRTSKPKTPRSAFKRGK